MISEPLPVDVNTVTIQSAGQAFIIVKWTKPAGTLADAYNVSLTGDAGTATVSSDVVAFSAAEPSVNVTNIRPGQTVTVRVTVVSHGKSSPPVDKSYTRREF